MTLKLCIMAICDRTLLEPCCSAEMLMTTQRISVILSPQNISMSIKIVLYLCDGNTTLILADYTPGSIFDLCQ